MSRIESDFLGELEIPDEAYYGVQTMRGKHNFNITEMPMSQEPFFAIAYGYVKKASVMTNKELGCIPADVADALLLLIPNFKSLVVTTLSLQAIIVYL